MLVYRVLVVLNWYQTVHAFALSGMKQLDDLITFEIDTLLKSSNLKSILNWSNYSILASR